MTALVEDPATPERPERPDAEARRLTLVVLHPAESPLAGHAWDAYVTGQPPFPVDRIAELNDALKALGVTATRFAGVAPCANQECPLAATTAVLTADLDCYRVAQGCEDHPPAASGLSCVIEGQVLLWSAYRRHSPGDVTRLVRDLIRFDVDPAVFTQPRCAHCHARLQPAPSGRTAWVTAAGSPGCGGSGRGHAPVRGEPADLIAGAVPQAAPDDGPPAALAS